MCDLDEVLGLGLGLAGSSQGLSKLHVRRSCGFVDWMPSQALQSPQGSGRTGTKVACVCVLGDLHGLHGLHDLVLSGFVK